MRLGSKDSLTGDMIPVLTTEGQGAVHTKIWGKGIPGRGSSKGPGAGISPVSSEGQRAVECRCSTVREERLAAEVREVGRGQMT